MPSRIWQQPIDEILSSWSSIDGARPGRWDEILDEKRLDHWYEDVVEEIRTRGFKKALTCLPTARWQWENKGNAEYVFGDGHHRLAAAIDLGMTTVPMRKCHDPDRLVAPDSGWWHC